MEDIDYSWDTDEENPDGVYEEFDEEPDPPPKRALRRRGGEVVEVLETELVLTDVDED